MVAATRQSATATSSVAVPSETSTGDWIRVRNGRPRSSSNECAPTPTASLPGHGLVSGIPQPRLPALGSGLRGRSRLGYRRAGE